MPFHVTQGLQRGSESPALIYRSPYICLSATSPRGTLTKAQRPAQDPFATLCRFIPWPAPKKALSSGPGDGNLGPKADCPKWVWPASETGRMGPLLTQVVLLPLSCAHTLPRSTEPLQAPAAIPRLWLLSARGPVLCFPAGPGSWPSQSQQAPCLLPSPSPGLIQKPPQFLSWRPRQALPVQAPF